MVGQDIIIRSTDTGILAIAMINQHKLDLENRNVVIHYGNSSVNLIYCHLNKLVESVTQDPKKSLLQVKGLPISRVLGALHLQMNAVICLPGTSIEYTISLLSF